MGGAQFFWRVTRLEGRGRDGTFRLERHSLPLDEPRPIRIPYSDSESELTYDQLLSRIPYIGGVVGQRVLRLPRNKHASFYHERHMAV